jgi:hypothetical protein
MNNLMDDKDIKQALDRMHDEVNKSDNLDEHGRRLLEEVDGSVRGLLKGAEAAGTRPSLEQAIRHFEVTHPTLTAALSDLLTALSNAGI